MKKFNNRVCSEEGCYEEYTPLGPAAKYCPSCALSRSRESGIRSTREYRIRNGLVKNPGVGKGGANAKYKEDSQYSTGIARFQNIRSRIKKERRYCERCGEDLTNASRYHWCVHHRDHDRSHNDDKNLELLCKSCHQIEHECHKAFEGATTIRKE